MKHHKNSVYLLLLGCSVWLNLSAQDVIVEFKGAYFQPVNHIFRKIYHGGALFGPEITFKVIHGLYGFASLDYFTKSGHSLGLNYATHVNFMPLGVGLKYLICARDHITPYIGLGILPTYVRTRNCSPYMAPKTYKVGVGGIAKVGTFFELPYHCMLDFFLDYSFVKVKCSPTYAPTGYVQPITANLSGLVVGVGVGYRFN